MTSGEMYGCRFAHGRSHNARSGDGPRTHPDHMRAHSPGRNAGAVTSHSGPSTSADVASTVIARRQPLPGVSHGQAARLAVHPPTPLRGACPAHQPSRGTPARPVRIRRAWAGGE